jgi:hypothetical protein
MSTIAAEILEWFRKLPMPERRELIEELGKETKTAEPAPAKRRTLEEVLGKFAPLPQSEVKDHNDWFAEAILASKRGEEDL